MKRIPTKTYKRFGQNLRILRLDRGLTQEKLAELADVHWTFVGKVERGEVNISLKNIIRFARGLKCQTEELVAGLV